MTTECVNSGRLAVPFKTRIPIDGGVYLAFRAQDRRRPCCSRSQLSPRSVCRAASAPSGTRRLTVSELRQTQQVAVGIFEPRDFDAVWAAQMPSGSWSKPPKRSKRTSACCRSLTYEVMSSTFQPKAV